jgi:hypothetical protein
MNAPPAAILNVGCKADARQLISVGIVLIKKHFKDWNKEWKAQELSFCRVLIQ